MTRKELSLRENAVIHAYSIGDKEAAIDFVMELRERNTEKKLYRFRTPKMHEVEALQKEKIYLCRPSQYEDFEDCKIEYDIADLCKYFMLNVKPEKYEKFFRLMDDNTMQQIIKNMEENPKFKRLNDNIRNECLIACISENYNSKMWEIYAQNYEGICYEYDLDSIILGIKNLRFFPVRYVEDRKNTKDIRFDSSDYNDTADAYQRAINKYMLSCLTKNKVPYAREYEWRLICEYMELNNGKTGTLFDFILPSKIILGKNISNIPEFENAIIGCANNKGIPVKKM